MASRLPPLSLPLLKNSAKLYANELTATPVSALFGATDGKAVGTYVESGFRDYLRRSYEFEEGNAASGIDFPDVGVDLKATSIRQPQSSCPFRDAGQKVYGLGYHLLVFVYEKTDDTALRAARLCVRHLVFVDKGRTADFQTTKGIIGILDRGGNAQEVEAFLEERNLPLDDIGRTALAARIMTERPTLGCLTISNALQWRLQYSRAIESAGSESGIENVLS